MPANRALLHGALLIIASEFMFAAMGAAVKAVSTSLPWEMTVFLRNLIGLFVILPLLLRRGLGNLQTTVPYLHLLRALAGVSAMYCFFYVLARLPLAEGVLLKMTSPIFMPLIALFWLREPLARLAVLAVPVGFVGVLLVLNPQGQFSLLALVGLMGGLLAALAKVTVRRLGRSEPITRIVFYFSLIATAVSAVPMSWGWRMPQPEEWGLVALMGVMGTMGQLLLTRGYSLGAAASVGPFTYFSVVFAALFGYLFWGETLDWLFVAGALLIVVAGVLAIRGRSSAGVS